jgi:TM2 domain-containing membrane protein YozV
MDCVNHPGVPATAFCQNCGKALCAACVRTAPGGQVLCEPCFTGWQSFQQPFAPINTGAPNPAAAAVLGLIPGVGAMYNGQFFKGLIHVVIFAVLVSMAHISGIFGIFIPAWILYQSFEAFHTAKALRDGLPVPDPLGLNDVGNWLNLGGRHTPYPGQPPAGQPGAPPSGGPMGSAPPGANPWTTGAPQPPPTGAWQAPYTGGTYPAPGQAPYQAPGQTAAQGEWQNPYAPPAGGAVPPGPMDPNAPNAPIPPIPPDPSAYWKPFFGGRGAPIGAVVLIALGTLFLLGQLDIFHGRLLEYSWPVFLIGLGVWLVVRRLGESQGGPK